MSFIQNDYGQTSVANDEQSQVDLINIAMKLNSTLSGTSNSANLAHQFYYHIPDPTLPYIENNLSKFDREQYKTMT